MFESDLCIRSGYLALSYSGLGPFFIAASVGLAFRTTGTYPTYQQSLAGRFHDVYHTYY